jgi:hypothetical protein
MKSFITILLLFITTTSYSQNFLTPSSKESFAVNNHTNRDVSYFTEVDNNNNILLVGTTERDSTFTDVLTTKLDSNLNLLWQKRFSLETELSYDIPLKAVLDDNDNLYIVGRSTSDQSNSNRISFVIKYDSNGNKLWSYAFNNTSIPSDYKYFYNNSFLDGDGNFRIVLSVPNLNLTAFTYAFYTLDTNGNLIEIFLKDNLVDHVNSNFTGLSTYFTYKNNNYYMRYRRNNITSNNSFYEHFIKKINSSSIETYPLNSHIDTSDTWSFNSGLIEIDSNSDIYFTYPIDASNKYKLLKLNSVGNVVLNLESPIGYDKKVESMEILSSGKLRLICNSKNSNSSNPQSINFIEYDANGNIYRDISSSSSYIDSLKRYSENQYLVYSSGNFRLFNEDLSVANEFLGSYNNFDDFDFIDNNRIVVASTTYNQMYPNSDFAAQQNILLNTIDTSQVTNSYSFSGEGTSKAFSQQIIIDNNDSNIIISNEKLGPDNLAIGGSRAPYLKSIYKYDANLNLLWSIPLGTFYNNPSSNGDDIAIDSSNDIYINTVTDANIPELIKISENGTIQYRTSSFRSDDLYLDINGDLNIVSPPLLNTTTNDNDIIFYVVDPMNGTVITNQVFPGLNFLGYYKSATNVYTYMSAGRNNSNNTNPKLKIYKNLNFEFETNLSRTGTFGAITSHSISDLGDINFSSSWGQNDAQLHKISLSANYSHVNLNNAIRQVLSISNGKVFTFNNDGYVKVYDSNLNLFSSSTTIYNDQRYLFRIGDYASFKTSFNVKVFDENSIEINEFKLPGVLSPTSAALDSNSNLLLTGRNGGQIRLNHEYSWARGFIHKYDFSDITLSENENTLVDHSFQIFPNPTNSVINILAADNTINHIKVYDINGRFISDTNYNQIDLTALPPSIYLIKVAFLNGSSETKKVIKY